MNAKKIAASTKNFVIKRKAPLAFATGIALTGVLATKVLKGQAEMYDSFLSDKGLLDEFNELINQEVN